MIILYRSCTFERIVSVVFFFFFKQKTAYEMRISDWSSDVCSSDLHRPYAEPRAQPLPCEQDADRRAPRGRRARAFQVHRDCRRAAQSLPSPIDRKSVV